MLDPIWIDAGSLCPQFCLYSVVLVLNHQALNVTGTALNALNSVIDGAEIGRSVELCIINNRVDWMFGNQIGYRFCKQDWSQNRTLGNTE